MQTQWKIITGFLLLTTAAGSNAQADRAADRKKIETDYSLYAKAMKQKNIQPLFEMMTKDATFKEGDGKIASRSELEATMKQMFATMTFTQITPKITKWVWQDNAALLDITVHSAGKMKTRDGKTHWVTYVSKSRDTWVKHAEGWRLQQIEAVGETMTRDGKPVVMPSPTPKK